MVPPVHTVVVVAATGPCLEKYASVKLLQTTRALSMLVFSETVRTQVAFGIVPGLDLPFAASAGQPMGCGLTLSLQHCDALHCRKLSNLRITYQHVHLLCFVNNATGFPVTKEQIVVSQLDTRKY